MRADGVITIHMFEKAGKRCLSGHSRIPATEDDMYEGGKLMTLMDKVYRVHVCRRCTLNYKDRSKRGSAKV